MSTVGASGAISRYGLGSVFPRGMLCPFFSVCGQTVQQVRGSYSYFYYSHREVYYDAVYVFPLVVRCKAVKEFNHVP